MGPGPPLRLLTFTTLFPNAEQPNHGIFVENRLRHLVETGAATATVLAPVPYFPSGARAFGAWGKLARVPLRETRHGLAIHHPRYLVIPKLGMSVAPALLYRAASRALAALVRNGLVFDAIDAHYVYPDGVAAVRLGARFGKPVVVTARGSDITQIAHYALPRAAIRKAIGAADALVGVSASLRDGLIALGAPPDKTLVLRNGVDTAIFRPMDRDAARARLRLMRPTLVSVGHLIERKRHHLAIEAMAGLPGCDLLIAGDGPERAALEALTARLGLLDRVRLLGALPHAELPALYDAADVLVLASSREGWANVLLEAMACGTPVVAMRIGGNAEVVRRREAGVIVDDAAPGAIADAVRGLLADPPDRRATRAYAEAFSWDDTSAGQIALFQRVLRERAGRSNVSVPAA